MDQTLSNRSRRAENPYPPFASLFHAVLPLTFPCLLNKNEGEW
jgi:hypothetical protein